MRRYNSISNVVASVTIDDNIYIYIDVRCSKKHESIVEGHKHIHVRRHVHIHIHIYMYKLVEEEEEGGDKPNHVTLRSVHHGIVCL